MCFISPITIIDVEFHFSEIGNSSLRHWLFAEFKVIHCCVCLIWDIALALDSGRYRMLSRISIHAKKINVPDFTEHQRRYHFKPLGSPLCVASRFSGVFSSAVAILFLALSIVSPPPRKPLPSLYLGICLKNTRRLMV